MHAETERLTASDAHLLLNISDRLLDQVNEVRGAELSQCVQRLGTGLDCGVQLLLEDPIVVPVSLLPITGDCDGSIGVMEGVRGERGSARCGEDVLFFFSRMLLRRGKTPGSFACGCRILRNSWGRHHGSDGLVRGRGRDSGSDARLQAACDRGGS